VVVLVVDGASAEGATPGEGSVAGVTADEGSVEAATADEAMVASSPVNSPEEGLRGGMVDTVMVMAGLGLDLVSPMPHGPTGMAITRTRPTTLLTPTLTTATRLHTIRMHTIRVRTTGVRRQACVASWEVLGEAAPLPAAATGAISAGADLGIGALSHTPVRSVLPVRWFLFPASGSAIPLAAPAPRSSAESLRF
jgi:hypothetical protein